MFKLNDRVTWTSQAQGRSKTKTGVIVEVVSPKDLPNRERFYDLYKGSGVGLPRDHVSYVVKVGIKHYWPRANKLAILGGKKPDDDIISSLCCVGMTSFEYDRLCSWMKDNTRQPANIAFTAGHARDAARAFEEYLRSR